MTGKKGRALMASDINDLKKQIFYELINLAGRVFVLVNYSEDVIIGSRGFLPEEKEKGLVLVFNNRMNFEWTGQALSAKLVFGSKPEQCFVPADEIVSVFSPELSAHFSVARTTKETPPQRRGKPKIETSAGGKKVVKVDFGKKK
jgi:hypothetical protein